MAPKSVLESRLVDDVPEVTPETLLEHLNKVLLIDVRRPDEFNNELAHIPGAKLVTLGPDLEDFLQAQNKEAEIVFICRSGARSGRATLHARSIGFSNAVNLGGGMLLWNEKKLPVERT